MRSAQSDFILSLLNDAEKVEVEIATHVDEVALRLGEWVGPLLGGGEEGPETPEFRATMLALKLGLGDSRERLNTAEQHNIELIRQAVELRGERQTLTEDLYGDFTSIRRTIEELYRGKGKANPNAFVVAGIQGPTEKRAKRLLRQIDLAVMHLSQPGLVFPASRFGATQLSPQELVEALQPRAQRLREVQAALQRLGSVLNASRKEKNRAMEIHERNLSWVSKAAAALFQLAGESELAERIRPNRRSRRRGKATEAEPAQQSEGQEGTEANAEGSESTTDEAASGGSSTTEPPSTDPESTESATDEVTATQAADSSDA